MKKTKLSVREVLAAAEQVCKAWWCFAYDASSLICLLPQPETKELKREEEEERGWTPKEQQDMEAAQAASSERVVEATRQGVQFDLSVQAILTELKLMPNETVGPPMSHLKQLREKWNRECKRVSALLPIYAVMDDIVQKVKNYSVLVVSAQTGSGKTTQIVQ
jgi:HrpA-like RNA helicase